MTAPGLRRRTAPALARSCSAAASATAPPSSTATTVRIDAALGAVYDREERGRWRRGVASAGWALGAGVSRWLGDIRRYFPVPVVQVLQRDAVERLDLRQLLLEPELLAELEPDVHLVACSSSSTACSPRRPRTRPAG